MSNILDQFTYFAFFQSLFLILIFCLSARKRQRINRYLLILVGLLLVGLIGKIGEHSLQWSRQIRGIAEFSILCFGPTVYLFVQSTLSEKRFSKTDLFHYIPALVYSLIVTFYFILPSKEVVIARVQSGELFRVVHILVGIGLSVNIAYFVLSVFKFKELKASLQREVSYVLNINFVQNFLIAIGSCLFIWLTVYLISFGDDIQFEIHSRKFIWMAIAIIILFISYYQMIAPTVFQFDTIVQETKYAQSKLSHTDLDALKQKLEQIMEDKKPHLNAKLLKSELAALMGVNAPELSRLLNERIGMSFFEFVNYHRIHEFIRLAKSPSIETKTLIGLAQEAGFQSKSTFNKSFKQIMGCTPSVYLKQAI